MTASKVEAVAADDCASTVDDDTEATAIADLREFRGRLSADFAFDRDLASERDRGRRHSVE